MFRKPFNTECKLRHFYSTPDQIPEPGIYLRSPAGSTYFVTGVIPSTSKDLHGYAGVVRLECLRVDGTKLAPDAEIWPIYWMSRDKKA